MQVKITSKEIKKQRTRNAKLQNILGGNSIELKQCIFKKTLSLDSKSCAKSIPATYFSTKLAFFSKIKNLNCQEYG